MPIEQQLLIAAAITVLCLSVVIFGLYRRAMAIERRLQGRTPREPANRCSSSLCDGPSHRRHLRTHGHGAGMVYADEPLSEDMPRLQRRRSRARGLFGFGDGLEGHLDYLERLGGGR